MKTLFSLLLFLSFSTFGQNEFSRIYADETNQKARSMDVATDGKAILLGRTNMITYLTKVDETGELIWSKKILDSGIIHGSQVKILPDASFLVSAARYAGPLGSGATIIRFDSNGEKIWSRTFNIPGVLSQHVKFILTDDSNILMYWFDGITIAQNHIVKLSMNGALIWKKTYTHSKEMIISSAASLADGSTILSGTLNLEVNPGPISISGYQPMLTKIDNNGDLIWTKHYPLDWYFESVFAHGNEFRTMTRTDETNSVPAGHLFSKFDSEGTNYANFIDTNLYVILSTFSEDMASSQKINDSTYHIYFKISTGKSFSLTIHENGSFENHESLDFFAEGASKILPNGHYYTFGTLLKDNSYDLQFYHSSDANKPCSYDTLTSVSFPIGPFSHDTLYLNSSDSLILIPTYISTEDHEIQSYTGCESQLNLEENEAHTFTTFPNPSSGNITINTTYLEKFEIELLDLQGRIVIELESKNAQVIQLKNLEAGSYVYRLKTPKGAILKTGNIVLN